MNHYVAEKIGRERMATFHREAATHHARQRAEASRPWRTLVGDHTPDQAGPAVMASGVPGLLARLLPAWPRAS